MQFYTNVIQRGNSLLVRGVEDGQRVSKRVNYRPTLFNKVSEYTGYKTLDGQHVLPKNFDSIKEAKAWTEQRSNQDILFGNTQYPYCYIGDEYPNDVPWDKDKILIVTIDIEVECENGFPDPKDAAEPLLSITMKNHQNKQIIVWGLHEFQNYRDDVDYRLCKNEDDLLIKFLDTWSMMYPDVITGWPHFFRSTSRESLVNIPAFFSDERKSTSTFWSALDIPCLIAPAWPDKPPP